MKDSYELIIIGSGIAGYYTAVSARNANSEMSILMISAESDITYSAPALADYIAGHIAREKLFVAQKDELAAMGIELCMGERVTAADSEKKLLTTESGKTFGYQKLVLATGSEPVRLRRMQGAGLPGNYVLKTVDDADQLAAAQIKRAVVVGSGAIGLEGASALRERGVESVTLVEALPWLNPKCFDKRASDYMVAELEKIGVKVVTGEAITSVEGADRVAGVHTDKSFFPCELVLWGIGMRPITDLAVGMGVKLAAHGGIKVDALMRTNLKDVYAVGDCTEPYDVFFRTEMPNMLWRTAIEQGMLAGRMLATGEEPEEGYEGGKLLFLTYVGDASACSYGYTEDSLRGQKYTVLENCQKDRYRKVILQKNKIVGFQMVNTLEYANELFAQMLKDAPVDMKAVYKDDFIYIPQKHLSLNKYLRQMR